MEARFDALQKLMSNPELAKTDLDAAWLNDLRIYWWLHCPEWKADINEAEDLLSKKFGLNFDARPGSSGDGGPALKKKKTAADNGGAAVCHTKAELLRYQVIAGF